MEINAVVEDLKKAAHDMREAATAAEKDRERIDRLAEDFKALQAEHVKAMAQIEAEREKRELWPVQRVQQWVHKDGRPDFWRLHMEPTQNDWATEVQRQADQVYLCAMLQGPHRAQRPDVNVVRRLKGFQRLQELLRSGPTQFRKAMDSATAGEGAEWIPDGWSAQVIERVELARKVARLFPRFRMTQDPFKMPYAGTRPTVYLQGEATADDAPKYRASQSGTASREWSAKKLACRVLFSDELEEDSIVPIAQFVTQDMADEFARGEEDAIINGDTAGTHQDTAVVTSADDHRRAFLGFRAHAVDISMTLDMSAVQTAAGFRQLVASMGIYGGRFDRMVAVTSIQWITKYVLGFSQVETIDKYGPKATIISGEAGKLYGIPIIASEFMSAAMPATGVITTSGSYTGLVLVRFDRYRFGDRRRLTIETDRDIETGQTVVVGVQRLAFRTVDDPTDSDHKVVAYGIKLTS